MNVLLAEQVATGGFDWAQFFGLFNYWIVIFLMMTGFYIVIARENLIKTIIGLNIFQTSVFLLYITMGKVKGGTTPIIHPSKVHHIHHVGHGDHGSNGVGQVIENGHAVFESNNTTVNSVQPAGFDEKVADHATEHAEHGEHVVGHIDLELIGGPFSNPLPSVLMLTAIVVGIATTALALALIVRIREDYGTIEEDEILEIDRQQGHGVREKKRKS